MTKSNRRHKPPVPGNLPPGSVVQVQHQYSGQLPPPDLFAAYNRGVPDAAERILVLAEEQQRADISANERMLAMQEQDINSGWRFALCGQFFAFVVVVIYLLILAMTIWLDNTVVFTAVFSAGVIAGLPSLVRSFQKIGQKPSPKGGG